MTVAKAATGPQTGETYLVQGVTVDVQGTSALDARDKAYVAARRMAWQQLAMRLVPARDQAGIVIPEDKMIASAIHDFSIKNEKMTSRRYAGTVDIRFTPAAVKRVMGAAQSGALSADTAGNDETVMTGADETPTPRKQDDTIYTAPRHVSAAASTRATLLLPWYGANGHDMLWGQNNPWRAAWEEKNGLSMDKSIILPVGDVEDMRVYSPAQPLGHGGDIDALMKRYGTTAAVLALAEPQENGNVLVSLFRYANNAATPIGRFAVDASSKDVMGDAVVQASGVMKKLNDNTLAPMQVSVAPGAVSAPQGTVDTVGTYRTLARFSGLQEWVAMRQALNRIPGMGQVNVHSISPSQANLEFDYKGNAGALMQAFAQSGLQISTLPQGTIVAGGPGDVPPQFLLSMGRVF